MNENRLRILGELSSELFFMNNKGNRYEESGGKYKIWLIRLGNNGI